MKRFLWRIELAWTMFIYGWGINMAIYVLRGNYDDPYYNGSPENPIRGRDVLVVESECQ